ncbi:radical SAM protein [Bacteroidota bacterium]
MLTGIHILLTYKCTFACDHCFLYSGPFADGTMTLTQIHQILDESQKIGSIEWIYFEGGEPFLFYPVMLEGIKMARSMGFSVGVVTNAYFATSEKDAEHWLNPLSELSVSDLSISDDSFHSGEEEDNHSKWALKAARKLRIPTSTICIEKPFVEAEPGQGQDVGDPVIGGGAMFKGRAVEKLATGLPQRPSHKLSECPHEDLQLPSRVHVDAFGYVHLCQGLGMGNMWDHPLSELVREYRADSHPICDPLVKGGPDLLARQYNINHEKEYVDECHFCYLVRRALINRFPEYLGPKQVYGLEETV